MMRDDELMGMAHKQSSVFFQNIRDYIRTSDRVRRSAI